MKVSKGKIFDSTEQYVITYVWNSGRQFFVNTINFNLTLSKLIVAKKIQKKFKFPSV